MINPTLEGEYNDAKTSILVHLTIYETSASNGTQERSITDCSTVDIETSMRKGGRVADLKSVLESQDVIPENVDEEFILEVRLRTTDTSCLQDFHIIQESVKEIYVTLKPKCIFSVQPPTSAVQTTAPPLSAYPDSSQQRTPENLSPPLSLLMNNVLRVAPHHPTQLFNLNESPLNHQDSLSEMMLTDPALLQQMMNSTVMRSLMSNSTVLRTILESNPQIRQLRERHPELNHLLNDSELLQQSMQAMQNPGLMREMISNTDRVLNNIDAIPGGYNALRRVYQSIQEPMWDVSFGCGSSQSETDCQPRDYNLERSGPPSTETIPNPWASPPPPPPPTARQTQITVPTIATASVNQHRSTARTTPSTTPLRNMSHTTNTTATATLRPPAESHVTSESPQQNDTRPVSLTRSTTSPHSRAEDLQTNATINVTTTPSVSLSPTPPDALPTSGVPKFETKQESNSSATIIPQEKTNTETPEQENPLHHPPSTTSSSLPFFYPPLFTPNRGLRSLGGLTLPVHIQGVIRPSPSKEDDEPIDKPRLQKKDHEDNED